MLSHAGKKSELYRSTTTSEPGRKERLTDTMIYVDAADGNVAIKMRAFAPETGGQVGFTIELTPKEIMTLVGDLANVAYRQMGD